MPLRCPPHAPFFLPTHLDCIVYSLHNDKNLSTKIDGNGPILMKIRLGEVWCCDDEFRSQHSPSHSFIDTGLLSIYYAYNCSLWFHILSCDSRSRYDIGVLFKMSRHHRVLARRHSRWWWWREVYRTWYLPRCGWLLKLGAGPERFFLVEFLLEHLTKWVEFLPILCDPPCYRR